MSRLCEGRVAIVTGAGNGIGRFHALELARQGAKVVVNDRGVARDGTGHDATPADAVVKEIVEAGGEAVADHGDVSDMAQAEAMVNKAIDTFGRLDVLVNNAGILRDRTIVNMTEEEWDAVLRVHLKGTFAPSRAAARHWRALAKAGNKPTARIINTSSSSGLLGNIGQSNYGAAKAGIAGFTVIAAMELAPYGVTVNAVSPGARTRMTEGLIDEEPGDFDPYDPAAIAPVVAWLASERSAGVTGQVFDVRGGHIGVYEGWRVGPVAEQPRLWRADEVDGAVRKLLAEAHRNPRLPVLED